MWLRSYTRRLTAPQHLWRKVYKTLTVIEFLTTRGADKCVHAGSAQEPSKFLTSEACSADKTGVSFAITLHEYEALCSCPCLAPPPTHT